MREIEFQQGSLEWKNWRKTKMTATDAAVVLDISPWKTPLQLWQQKMGLSGDDFVNDAMRTGNALEPIALYAACNELKLDFVPKVLEHANRWMGASFDGVSSTNDMALEIKCSAGILDKANYGQIDDHYKAQMHHQMYVLGIPCMLFFAFWNSKYKVIEVKQDEKYIDDLVKKEYEFYLKMQNLEEPDLTDRDYVFRSDEEWVKLAQEYSELARIDKRREEIKKRLKELSGGQSSMGGGLKISKHHCRGIVNYGAIPELIGVDLDHYRKPTYEKWRIDVR